MTSSQLVWLPATQLLENFPVRFQNYVKDYEERPCNFPEDSGMAGFSSIFYLCISEQGLPPGSG